jgi:RNA polymerase sporulation-specific sigma factor
MLSYFLGMGLLNLLFFALHVTSKGSFPKPLTAKQEAELLEKKEAGDGAAREKLIVHNLRLVAHIAKKYYGCAKEQEDLISIGTVGLIKGVDTFSSDKKIKLATYASRCIENEILMSLRARKKNERDVYFHDPIDSDNAGHPLTLLDIVAKDENIADEIDLKIKAQSLGTYIQQVLTPREKHILIQRYGLGGASEKTQLEIAEKLGISRSYVSRIEKKALGKLRAAYMQKR